MLRAQLYDKLMIPFFVILFLPLTAKYLQSDGIKENCALCDDFQSQRGKSEREREKKKKYVQRMTYWHTLYSVRKTDAHWHIVHISTYVYTSVAVI